MATSARGRARSPGPDRHTENHTMTNPSNETFQARLRRLELELDNIKKSRSWRWTEFFRMWAYRIRNFLRRPRAVPVAGPGESDAPARARDTTAPATPLADAKQHFTTLADAVLQEFLASAARLRFPTSDTPAVSIVVVVWNRVELTFQCLRSLVETGREASFELIIVDNASSDRTPDLLGRLDGVRAFRNEENRYFVPAVNQAAALARGEYLLLLNNDAILMPGAIAAAVETIGSAADIGAVGGKIVLLDGSLQEAGNIVYRDGSCAGYGRGGDPLASEYMFRREVDYCSGAFLLTRRELFERMEGLDEIFMPVYYEETDYCLRLRDAGYRVIYEPRSVVFHYEFGSSTPENAAEKQLRNQKVFAERHRGRLNSLPPPGTRDVLADRIAERTKKRVLVIDDRVPHLYLGSGFPRANRILKRLVEWGVDVTLYPMGVPSEEWDCVYESIPREVEVAFDSGPEGLESFLIRRKGFYDTVLVSRPHNMALLRPLIERDPTLLDGAKLLYDAEAIFAFREAKRIEVRGLDDDEDLERRLAREVELAQLADGVISVSSREAREFLKRGVPSVHVLGHAYDVEATTASFDARAGFLFVGAIHGTDTPNGDSILWFVREVLPRIRERDPNAVLTVIGVIRSQEVSALASDWVRLLGPCNDLRPHYEQARVFVAPTRFSAGVPLKVTEAAIQGIPVVATPLLAEQLSWRNEQELLVGETPTSFAAQCVRLHSDRDTWTRIRNTALGRACDEYSADLFDKTLLELMSPPLGASAPQR